MEITLRGALLISAAIHAVILAPFFNNNLLQREIEKRNTSIVDYVILKEIATAISKNKEVALKKPETPQVDIRKEISVKPEVSSQAKADNEKKSDLNKIKEKTRLHKKTAIKDASKEAASKEAQAKKSADYVNYYQLIREKIRSKLKDNYQYYDREGEVYLTFVITQNGSLLSYSIDRSKSAEDETLLNVTARSVKAASPFPPLPKSLSMSRMSFNVVVSFKK